MKFRRLLVSAGVALSMALACPAAAVAQENRSEEPATQSKEQSALVDGLLDLLDEPATQATDVKSLQRPAQADADLSGADLSGAREDGSTTAANLAGDALPPNHPLVMVHRSMRSAAEQLGKGVVGPDTQRLQGDILQQLDDLIEQLQGQNPAHSPPQPRQQSSVSQSQSSRMSTEEESSSAQQTPADDSQPGGEQHSDSGQGAQDRPSQASADAEVAVDLADPQRLQQDVWGQLPEQMRKQMQSRMVESFLPSYRPQIEAYFRKLLESESQ